MRVRILPSSVAGTPGHSLTGLIVNDTLALDAGPLGFWGTVEQQAEVRHVLLTHSHIDHIAGLPVFLDNVYRLRPGCPSVYALKSTLQALQSDLFNGRLMPDFIGMSEKMTPFLAVREIVPDLPTTVGNFMVIPFHVDHTIPTLGYLIDDGKVAIAIVTDTRPVPTVMSNLGVWPRLKAVFLECSFPDHQAELAKVSKHMTVSEFAESLKRLPQNVTVYPIHIKPRFYADVEHGLRKLNDSRIQWSTCEEIRVS